MTLNTQLLSHRPALRTDNTHRKKVIGMALAQVRRDIASMYYIKVKKYNSQNLKGEHRLRQNLLHMETNGSDNKVQCTFN